jgi:hypothetical protein
MSAELSWPHYHREPAALHGTDQRRRRHQNRQSLELMVIFSITIRSIGGRLPRVKPSRQPVALMSVDVLNH